MPRPRFSIIIPMHNSAEFCNKGLDSIKAQEFHDYEVIAVCDACTDNSAAIAAKYTHRIAVTDYGNPGEARNRGIEMADGEYILFMDSDDWLLHEYVLSQLHSKLLEQDCDILAFSFIFKHWMYATPRGNRGNYWFAVWNKAWKASFVKDLRFNNKLVGEDVDFQREAMRRKPKIIDWDMPLYYYNYMRKGSISEMRGR